MLSNSFPGQEGWSEKRWELLHNDFNDNEKFMTNNVEEEKYKLLRTRVGQIVLKELLEPLFPKFLKNTINSDRLAQHLFEAGVMTPEELNEFKSESMSLYKNLEVYRSVNKKNAGQALVDALHKSENFPIIKILQSQASWYCRQYRSEQAPKGDAIKHNRSPIAVSLLEVENFLDGMFVWTENAWKDAVLREYKPMIGESTSFDRHKIMVRVAVAKTISDPDSSFPNRHYCNKLHPDEKIAAITEFFQSQLELDLNKKFGLRCTKIGRPPIEMYINTRSFSSQQWEWLSRLLFEFCRDSLENLWLDRVNYREYLEGIKWTENIEVKQEQPRIWFTKLKAFIFEGVDWDLQIGPSISDLHNVLLLIKPISYPLRKLWNEAGCSIQISTGNLDWCKIVMDPSSGTLFLGDLDQSVPDEIDHFSPLSKMYYHEPRFNLFKNDQLSQNLRNLTHLFVSSWKTDGKGVEVITDVVNKLPQLGHLRKLMLEARKSWSMDLRQINVLKNLELVYIFNAKIKVNGAEGQREVEVIDNEFGGLENFPWRNSLKTVIFHQCQIKSGNTKDWKRFEDFVLLERKSKLQQMIYGGLPNSFVISNLKPLIPHVSRKLVEEFFHEL